MAEPLAYTGPWRHSPLPIISKCFRERCRPGMLAAWALITLTVTTAICLACYLGEIERAGVPAAQAARAMIFPIILIQAALLMFLGTGAVAYGIATERDTGVLDYQRMTPMSVPAKIIGYLFGLPIREYLLFLLTVPFLIFAVVRGEFSWSATAHFYFIFFLSVIVYHMTGLVSGMITTKARRAAVSAQVFVVVLYFGLTNLSHLGLTFFEFFTIRPALFDLVIQEISRLNDDAAFIIPPEFSGLTSFRDIPIFSTTIHATLYTVIVQGGLLATMWHTVSRKWRAEDAPAFSKVGATLLILGTSTLALGSAWASLSADGGFFRQLAPRSDVFDGRLGITLTLVYALMVLCLGMFTLANCSSSPFQTSKGFHRMRKHGWRTLGLTRDESSSLPQAILVAISTAICAALMYRLLIGDGIVAGWPDAMWSALVLICLASAALFAQAVFERYTLRGRCVVLFVVWVVPVLAFAVMAAAGAEPSMACYVSLPCPPAAAFFATDQLTASIPVPADANPIWLLRQESELENHYPKLPAVGVGIQVALAIGAQAVNLRDRARRRRTALTAI